MPFHALFLRKRCSCRYISVLFLRSRKRHVAAAGTQHWSLSAFTPFGGALLCNRTGRALLPPLPTDQGLLAERRPQPHSAVCAHRPNLAGTHFRIFFFIKAISAHLCHSGHGMQDGGGGGNSGPGRNGRRPGEHLSILSCDRHALSICGSLMTVIHAYTHTIWPW